MNVFRLGTVGLATALFLAGCGGDSPDSAPTASTGLTGSVAVGAPITDGTLRVIDATGTVVATVTVADDGSYTTPALTGTGPYRIEACGYAGSNYTCIYSVSQGAGTANVTPLTTATVLLATGQTPSDLMSGNATGLSGSALEAAQQKLRTGLASVLVSGNVPASFDFVTGNLTAGSRSGYDKVLDAIGVSTGVDDSTPFVQITPRLGTGNLYLEQNVSIGSVTAAVGAANLSLGGLEGLFQNMSAAMASPSACSNATTGMPSLLATNARISDEEGASLTGPSAVAQGLCGMFAAEGLFGSRLLSPTLGRCDLGSNPVCRVSFVLQTPDGAVEAVGQGMGVTQEAGVWKFLGDVDALQVHASAKTQRDQRIDGGTPVYSYSRAIAFDIPAVAGLACAKISQNDASAQPVTIAYYKRFGSGTVRRLSLWQQNMMSNSRSLDPTTGALRSADDTWVGLPDGTEGDTVVRNFFRGGRSVTVSLYSDTNCTTPFAVPGQTNTSFDVEVQGVPPVSAAMAALPWPELTTAGRNAVLAMTLTANGTGTMNTSWTLPRGAFGLNGIAVCTDRARCGQDDIGRAADQRGSPTATSATVLLEERSGAAIGATHYKMLSLHGRTADGMDMQSNYIACDPGSTTECH